MKKTKTTWVVDVEYPSEFYFLVNADGDIERAVGRKRVSSGMGFGRRDMQFEFKTEKAARAAAERLKQFTHAEVDVAEYR